ncbi:Hypothetical protein CINCED_3A001971 [Cinara cedri]|uniref:Uncharacterized protein n=1 Tax=Cinara cedri TaxID=506608 RepID=A0A5E4NI27_9HEMI|nr:Hypothetical protein CINCED_3A001971 [Cinara cedri]
MIQIVEEDDDFIKRESANNFQEESFTEPQVEDIIQIEEEDDDFIKRELANNLQEDPITEPQGDGVFKREEGINLYIISKITNHSNEDSLYVPQHRYIKNTIEVDVNEILHARKEPAVRKIYKERFSVIHTLETQKKSCERHTIEKLRVLHDHNILVVEFKTARMANDNCKVVIYSDRVPRSQHERQFNVQTTNKIAAIVGIDEQTTYRDIVVHVLDGMLTRVPDTH